MNLPHISDWQNEAGVPDADCSPSHPVKTSVAQYRYPSVSRRGDVRVWAGRYTRVAGRYRAQEWGTYACRYGYQSAAKAWRNPNASAKTLEGR